MLLEYKAVRLFFKKQGRCVYISHLDLNRAMSRALARSNLPIWHTMGFNPHIYTTFALPLSLGTTGLSETMDFKLADDYPMEQAIDALNKVFPEGLVAISISTPVMEPKEIMWADYDVLLNGDLSELGEGFNRLNAMEEIPMEKRSKKGMKTIDIKPMMQILSMEHKGNQFFLKLRCRAGVEINLNPTLILEAAQKYCGIQCISPFITRVQALNEECISFN